jgi:surface carbohydrate biosynthesis protein (TIGR04326 family)
MSEKTSLILLDEDADWDGESLIIAHWVKLNVSKSRESIPHRTAEQAQEIKSEYFSWVHDLGRAEINGKTLIASLNIIKNLSYWWMTSIAIKSPFENEALYAVFKLRALEILYFEKKCSGIIYCGNNKALNKTLQTWCQNLGHPYKRIGLKNKMQILPKGIRGWLRKLPYWFQALAFLIKNIFLRYRHVESISAECARQVRANAAVTIVNYFPNIDMKKIKRGEYWSRYWEELHPVLDKLDYKINWVWFYFDSSGFKFEDAISFRDACNRQNSIKNRYFVIEEFLTLDTFLKALSLYLKIYKKGLSLKGVSKVFNFSGSKLNFYPIMEKEWKASFFGNIAMEGAVRIAMFDYMAKVLPASPWGLFTWENLSWDFALISAWRRHQKQTKILAAQHGFFRTLDLRLCSDSRDFCEVGQEAIPLPDVLCTNNVEGVELLQNAGFPQEKIAKTEALRYFGLKGRYQIYKKPLSSKNRTLLVIMGITDQENQFQFELLKEAASNGGMKSYKQIWVKPHPGLSPNGLKPVYESNIDFLIKDQPLSELWSDADVVYGAHSTGATWEASWYGIPAIAAGAFNSLDLNPLSSLPKFCFATNGSELSEQLKNPQLVEIPEDYFFLDEDLKLWKSLLEN